MEYPELNLWLLKKTQTESSLQTEERRLETVRREYASEINKYQSAKQTFLATKQKLLDDKKPEPNPAARFQNDQALSHKLKSDKQALNDLTLRLSNVEGKVRKQGVLVLQSKKKLEVLQEKINVLEGRKISKRNLKEELEILDGKIQQMAIVRTHAAKFPLKDKLAVKEEEPAEEAKVEICKTETPDADPQAAVNFEIDQAAKTDPQPQCGFSGENQEQRHHQQTNNGDSPVIEENTEGNKDFYEGINDLAYLNSGGTDRINLSYRNKGGNVFELVIWKGADQGLVVEIKPQSRLDVISLNSGKYEIIRSLKSRGLKLNSINISGA